MNYMNQKRLDKSIEEVISDYTQRYFWNKVGATRVTDRETQIKGIDYIWKRPNSTLKIDEKAKYYNCLNRILQYPSVEISIKNRLGLIQDGWFQSENTETDYYAYLAIFSTADHHNNLTVENITKVNMMLVYKKDVEYIITNDIKHDAKTLRDYTDLRLEAGDSDIDNRKHYSHHKYWLTYSYKLNEQPVNLVIPRDKLLSLKHTIELEITPTGLKTIKKQQELESER